MSEENKAAKADDKKAPAAKQLVVRVKVTKGGVQIGGATAGRGAVLNVYQDAAGFHEKRGEVVILGTA